MMRSMYSAISGLKAQQTMLDVTANNLANVNTIGFKAGATSFQDALSQTQRGAAAANAAGGFAGQAAAQVGLGVQIGAISNRMTGGGVQTTGNPLDIAISGEGFFAVQTADGTAYTRAGRFTLDATGQIVTSSGLPVLAAGGGPIRIEDGGQISIAADGTVSTEQGIVARLQVVTFEDPQRLQRGPDGLYAPGDQAPVEVAAPQVVQGMIEQSNVSPILEMTRLIDVTRSYQRMSQIIESEHQRQRQAINSLAKAA